METKLIFGKYRVQSYVRAAFQTMKIEKENAKVVEDQKYMAERMSKERKKESYPSPVILPNHARQEDVFATVAKPMIDQTFDGYNSNVILYGARGSGKRYTMFGRHSRDSLLDKYSYRPYAPHWTPQEEEDKVKPLILMAFPKWPKGIHKLIAEYAISHPGGILPRTIDYIFSLIERAKENDGAKDRNLKFRVELQFHSFHSTRGVHDLLGFDAPPRSPHSRRIRTDAVQGPYIHNATVLSVQTANEAKSILRRGLDMFSRYYTFNGSIFHVFNLLCSFNITVSSNGKIFRKGKFRLVFLRSSNVCMQSITPKVPLQSLHTVMNSLIDRKSFVPYRNASLTYILKEALGGSDLTTFLTTVRPIEKNKNLRDSLEFSRKACKIWNTPSRSRIPSGNRAMQRFRSAALKVLGMIRHVKRLKKL